MNMIGITTRLHILGETANGDHLYTTSGGKGTNHAFAVSISEGKSVNESVSHGIDSGALVVTRLGAQEYMSFRKEAENLMSSSKRSHHDLNYDPQTLTPPRDA
jgi:sugar/nucleoside kinase (ribokinase family)